MREIRTIAVAAGGLVFATAALMNLAVRLGRSMALMVHPRAAWITLSLRGRAALVAAYVAASYVLTLAALTAT